ncbi:MAG: hypothetical protein HQL06_15885 [Nitrospirae bacterium]|nr:hypothetical protein [Nitrospirota bacterium]
MSFEISQSEADALIAMIKIRIDDTTHKYPDIGNSLRIPLISENRRHEFMLDITRSKIELNKGSFQNRARQTVILLRLCFGGQPHKNPDDTRISCPHLHSYKEGYADKWAIPLPEKIFFNPINQWQTLQEFMLLCNIINPPIIAKGLFT